METQLVENSSKSSLSDKVRELWPDTYTTATATDVCP